MRLFIKKAAEAKGMTLDKLAEQTGLTKTMIWNYESGRNNPKIADLCKIADVLDVSLDMLVYGEEKDRPSGRSKIDIMALFDDMSEEEAMRTAGILYALVAHKRHQAHLDSKNQE